MYDPPYHAVHETSDFVSPVPMGLADGHHTTYHHTGSRWEEYDTKDGKRHGPYRCYGFTATNDDGPLIYTCTYVDGVREGPLIVGDPKTASFTEVIYRGGVIQSSRVSSPARLVVSIHTTDSEGTREDQTVWTHDGTVVGTGSFLNRAPVGVHRTELTGRHDDVDKVVTEWEFRDAKLSAYREVHHRKGGPREEKVHVPYRGTILKKFYWWDANGILAEERDLDEKGNVLRVLVLRDKSGRDCLLKDDKEITVWKLGKAVGTASAPWVYIRLTVPADARRVTPQDTDYKYKSRVEFAKVEEIVGEDGTEYKEAVSGVRWRSDDGTTYRVGEIVRPDHFDPSPVTTYTNGIHVHAYRDQCDVWKNAG